jgi:hypothetical protein
MSISTQPAAQSCPGAVTSGSLSETKKPLHEIFRRASLSEKAKGQINWEVYLGAYYRLRLHCFNRSSQFVPPMRRAVQVS